MGAIALVCVTLILVTMSCTDRSITGSSGSTPNSPAGAVGLLAANVRMQNGNRMTGRMSWVGAEHNSAIRSITTRYRRSDVRRLSMSERCLFIRNKLTSHFAERIRAGYVKALPQDIESGLSTALTTLGCAAPATNLFTSQSIFASGFVRVVAEDSVPPIVVDPMTEVLVGAIEVAAQSAPSLGALVSTVAGLVGQSAGFDSLSAAIVASAATTAVDSYSEWESYYASGGGPGEQPEPQSLFASPLLRNSDWGGLAKKDVAGGWAAVVVGCIRPLKGFRVNPRCLTLNGLGGIFVAGAAGVSLYEWLQ